MCNMKELFTKLAEVKAVSTTESGVDVDRLRYIVDTARANINFKKESVRWKELRATESA